MEKNTIKAINEQSLKEKSFLVDMFHVDTELANHSFLEIFSKANLISNINLYEKIMLMRQDIGELNANCSVDLANNPDYKEALDIAVSLGNNFIIQMNNILRTADNRPEVHRLQSKLAQEFAINNKNDFFQIRLMIRKTPKKRRAAYLVGFDLLNGSVISEVIMETENEVPEQDILCLNFPTINIIRFVNKIDKFEGLQPYFSQPRLYKLPLFLKR